MLAVEAIALFRIVVLARGTLMVFDGIEMLIRIDVDDLAVFVDVARRIGLISEVLSFVGVPFD